MIKIKNNKIRWFVSAILALLILFGTFHSVFSLIAFVLCGLMLVFVDKEDVLYQIFFIMPMANIFKMSPGTQSFFTIIILAFVVLHLVLPRKATLLVVLFAVYVLLGEIWGGAFNLFRTIKLICNLLFLSSVLNSKVDIDHRKVFFSYIIGNIVASVFGMMDSSMFKIHSYIGLKELGGLLEPGEEQIYRFAGLYEDPNYYSIGLIVSLTLLLVLNHRNEIKTGVMMLFAVPIVYFIVMTYSKSAFLMLALFIVFWMYSLYLKKKYFSIVVIFTAAAGVLLLALFGRIPFLQVIMDRFLEAGAAEGDLNAMTTGRFDLWMMYTRFFVKHFTSAIFGRGISSELLNGWGAHNTYIDIVYFLGAIGGTLLVAILTAISIQSVRVKARRNILNYSVIIFILIMYFFLSELFYFDPPFHLFLAFMVLNLSLRDNVSPRTLNN